ncbi:hypothetical protein [Crocosphaera chwakensis]|uniref:DUF2283 domain-containing protein n=1 Tax=Crocosphaera chwakensis CCY0110 TaxID=391612 RepID=A3IPD3_9CHRO|nr:hypothetical protein [Crocosphaera chwakensis]EAZ91698.1 hypothetical protein CY0110_26243 [Crocosphaera chwakensis CCY0110]
MDNLKIYHDHEAKTLTIWFDDPKKEFLVDEVEEDLSLIKDQQVNIIGIERLNYLGTKLDASKVKFVDF